MSTSRFFPVANLSAPRATLSEDLRNLSNFLIEILGKDTIVRTTLSEVAMGNQCILIELVGIYKADDSELFVLLASLGNEIKRFFPNHIIQCYSSGTDRIIFWNSDMVAPIEQLLEILKEANDLLPKTQELAKSQKEGGKCDCWISHFHDESGHTCRHHRTLSDIAELTKVISRVVELRNSGEAFQAFADDILRRFNNRHNYLGIKEAMGR